MVKASEIPKKSVYRLSIYQRCLNRLRENDVVTVSSEKLAKVAGVKSAQLRRDLAYVGQIGTRGLGYPVDELTKRINHVLGATRLQPVVLVGVGNLGAALLHYDGFNKEGFEITAAFDINPRRSSEVESHVPILPQEEMRFFIQEHHVKMAILCVPAKSAQPIANELVTCGVQAILNFAPTVLQVPGDVQVNNVDLAMELEHLRYFVR